MNPLAPSLAHAASAFHMIGGGVLIVGVVWAGLYIAQSAFGAFRFQSGLDRIWKSSPRSHRHSRNCLPRKGARV